MNCFYHPGTAAVGICKSCSKGLCPSCAVDLGKGLACRNRCEGHATSLINLIDDNIKRAPIHNQIVDTAGKNRYVMAAYCLCAGFLFTGFAVYQLFTVGFESSDIFLWGLGTLFLLVGLFALYRAITFASAKK